MGGAAGQSNGALPATAGPPASAPQHGGVAGPGLRSSSRRSRCCTANTTSLTAAGAASCASVRHGLGAGPGGAGVGPASGGRRCCG